MPDTRSHRGPHPEDADILSARHLPALRSAVVDLSHLLSRGYAMNSALKLVGDRFQLTARQRMAVRRCACTDDALRCRIARRKDAADLAGQPVGVDGYNLLITIESALSGGAVIVGRDGCYRDLASVHGTYHNVTETVPAITLIAKYLDSLAVERIDWYLDSPVSNSGRLKALMADVLEDRCPDYRRRWNIKLVNSPDKMLIDYPGVVVSTDSVVLDGCGSWTNLAATMIDGRVRSAWLIDLRTANG